MNRTLLISLLLLFTSLQAVAQTRVVSGQVTGADDKQPIPGVNIIVVGTNKGTSTDANGKYTIELAANENALSFTFVGYKIH
jgi:hypothetical protein